MAEPDRPAIAVGAVALAAACWTVASGVLPSAETVPALLVPALFLLAGLLGPIWRAPPFTCRVLDAIGAAHLLAIAASAAARELPGGAAGWQAVSLLLFVAGFAAMLPLAAGYPAGPPSPAAVRIAGVVLLLPIAAAFSGPTPTVLSGSGAPLMLGPIAALLPPWVANAAAAAFAVPIAAVVVAVIRAARGGRELRGRLLVPLGALGAFALLLAAGAVLPAPQVTTALVLVSAPLVPAGLVLGSRPLAEPLDAPAPRIDGAVRALSPREREVLAAMAEGSTNAVIAKDLHMSLSAVEKHTTAIFTKLGLPPGATTHRRVAAVVAYLRASR